MIIKYVIFAVFMGIFLLWFIGGYIHAQRRMKKGLAPLAYHKVSKLCSSISYSLEPRPTSASVACPEVPARALRTANAGRRLLPISRWTAAVLRSRTERSRYATLPRASATVQRRDAAHLPTTSRSYQGRPPAAICSSSWTTTFGLSSTAGHSADWRCQRRAHPSRAGAPHRKLQPIPALGILCFQ